MSGLDLEPVNSEGGARVEPPRPPATCPHCRGTGLLPRSSPTGYRVVEECDARKKAKVAELYNRSGIPGRYAGSTLEMFQPLSDTLGLARATCLGLVQAWPSPQPGLLLMGNPGLGKTHLLAGVVRALVLRKGVAARYVDFTHLMNELRGTLSRKESPQALLGALVGAPVLAIDDLGRGLLETDYEAAVIDELVSRRYNADRLTLFSSNFRDLPPPPAHSRSESNLSSPRPRSLTEVVGERVVSRLRQMSRFLVLEGQDFREEVAPRSLSSPPRPRTSRPFTGR